MDEVFFLETTRKGELELYERDGDFENEGSVDLLIATFHDKRYAEKICDLLNKAEQE